MGETPSVNPGKCHAAAAGPHAARCHSACLRHDLSRGRDSAGIGGKPPDPRASRTAVLRASGTTKRGPGRAPAREAMRVSDPGQPPAVVIVGGGIAGLAAALFLRDTPARIIVLEGAPLLGGKLTVSDVAGAAVDEGAEALLTRRPEGTGLIDAVGLTGSLV